MQYLCKSETLCRTYWNPLHPPDCDGPPCRTSAKAKRIAEPTVTHYDLRVHDAGVFLVKVHSYTFLMPSPCPFRMWLIPSVLTVFLQPHGHLNPSRGGGCVYDQGGAKKLQLGPFFHMTK